MQTNRLAPGVVRDAVRAVMVEAAPGAMSLADLHAAVVERVGRAVSESSVRSSVLLHPEAYVRVARGRYRLGGGA
jgi:hypothetical protein